MPTKRFFHRGIEMMESEVGGVGLETSRLVGDRKRTGMTLRRQLVPEPPKLHSRSTSHAICRRRALKKAKIPPLLLFHLRVSSHVWELIFLFRERWRRLLPLLFCCPARDEIRV